MLTKRLIPFLARAAGWAPPANTPIDPEEPSSILSLAAVSFGARPSAGVTIPTGFDPVAVTLFEAIVEGAFLVANADGLFDDEERRTLERIVVDACGGAVASQQVAALVGDLRKQLGEEGVERRIRTLAAGLSKKEHAQEVLRVGALIAQASDGASAVERDTLTKIAAACGLDVRAVDDALAEAKVRLDAVVAT